MTMKSKDKARGTWISVDGSEGVGKTLFTDYLRKHHTGFVVVPEFSDTHVGRYLKDSVTSNPHFITSSKLGQSLLFLSDFFTLYDTVILPNLKEGKVVVSDRGFLSRYVYQFIVLSDEYSENSIFDVLDSLFNLISPPSLTICIQTPIEMQRKRLADRDGCCSDERLNFIKKANYSFEAILKRLNVKTSVVVNESDVDKDGFITQCMLLFDEHARECSLSNLGD